MLLMAGAMQPLTDRVQNYLKALGLPATQVRRWPGQDKLPYFLKDAFEFGKLELLGKDFVLALDRQEKAAPAKEIRNRLDKVEAVAGHDAVYVAHALLPYQRKRLIEQHVPFIVPGKQFFIPALLDVRDRVRRQVKVAVQGEFPPATQAMLFALLLDATRPDQWMATAVGTRLGYTPMTVTRAVRELEAAKLVRTHVEGRFQHLTLAGLHADVWNRAQPFLRTPVHRVEWADELPLKGGVRLAGESALAECTMLTEPTSPTYAMTRADWRKLRLQKDAYGIEGEGYEVQLWNYTPALRPEQHIVDPLSLFVSMRGHPDERVQMAIKELQEQLPW